MTLTAGAIWVAPAVHFFYRPASIVDTSRHTATGALPDYQCK